jgi:hypothetical protein
MNPAGTSSEHAEQMAAVGRVRRNFWCLVAATIIAAGVLSDAVARPAGPATAALVAASSVAAVISVSLAGRILVVTSRLGPRRKRRRLRRRAADLPSSTAPPPGR